MENTERTQRQYLCIDLKSYYASVECVARGLDPLTARLLVADDSRTDKTIVLAVSPALKALGVPSCPRLFEAKERIRMYEAYSHTTVDYIIAPPRMAEYLRISAKIYEIYLRYVAEQDIHVYSIRSPTLVGSSLPTKGTATSFRCAHSIGFRPGTSFLTSLSNLFDKPTNKMLFCHEEIHNSALTLSFLLWYEYKRIRLFAPLR